MAKRQRHLLTDLQVRKAKPKERPYRLADGGGLYLWVPPSGVLSWQFRYRYMGKPQTATLGKLSGTQGLAWARNKADEARSRTEDGDHLTRLKAVKKAAKGAAAANTFATLAADWVKAEGRRAKWTPDYKDEVAASLRNHVSALDPLMVSEITAAMISPSLRRLERNAPDMAKKVRQRLRSIFDYAVEGGLITGNPLPAARRRKGDKARNHLPAVLTKEGVGVILRSADMAEVGRGVRRAHTLAVFTAQRIGEIVGATWDEIDLQTGVWSIPRDRMKRKDAERGSHLVPVPPLLLPQMREWKRADGKDATYICPGPRGDAPITREAVEKFYRRGLRLTGKHSPHSWRSVLSTWANDAGEDADAVEAQLDHVTGSKVKAAYDRAKRLKRRADLMAWHEQALLAARDGAKVISLPHRDRA
ncbi:MAG: tyrosine-type recombinase/integrase [Burkholderiales bacterium]